MNRLRESRGIRTYFYEFLVLFIAVFMGFLAENFRERLSEKQKEKNLVQNFLTDLKSDTAALSDAIIINTKKFKLIEEFIQIRELDFSQQSNLHLFYDKFLACKMWSIHSF
jgi:hypothetical protein